MPTYAYRCPGCGHEYEKLQKISDRTRAKCPRCGKRGDRLISGGAGLVFKGSGFYITDYKKKGGDQREERKEDKKREKKQEGKQEGKSQHKSDAGRSGASDTSSRSRGAEN